MYIQVLATVSVISMSERACIRYLASLGRRSYAKYAQVPMSAGCLIVTTSLPYKTQFEPRMNLLVAPSSAWYYVFNNGRGARSCL